MAGRAARHVGGRAARRADRGAPLPRRERARRRRVLHDRPARLPLQLPADVDVDLDEARESLARRASQLADGVRGGRGRRAGAASSLARLPFLPNHEGEWVDGIRRELATIHARALEVEARAHAAAGDLAAAATAAERLVQAEPFNEAAHQLRIRILGQAGDRSGAIVAYEHCRDVLAAELGVEPSDETATAYRAATAATPGSADRPPARPRSR